jgi:hypothetical protein
MIMTPAVTAQTSRPTLLRNLALWSVSFLAIPLAGELGTLLVGRVDNVASALVGGAIVGAILGFVQALVSRGRLSKTAWTVATTAGVSVGVALATFAVGYGTSLPALALGGLITGVVVGIAQYLALPSGTRRRLLWVPITAALWPLGWTTTTLFGIRVDLQFIIFGASGAIVYTVLAGLALHVLLRRLTPIAR